MESFAIINLPSGFIKLNLVNPKMFYENFLVYADAFRKIISSYVNYFLVFVRNTS